MIRIMGLNKIIEIPYAEIKPKKKITRKEMLKKVAEWKKVKGVIGIGHVRHKKLIVGTGPCALRKNLKDYRRLFHVDKVPYPNTAVNFSKVIMQHGRSRGYFMLFVRNLIELDFTYVLNSVRNLRLRKTPIVAFRDEIAHLWRQTMNWKKTSILEMFSIYVRLTQPILAFFLVRKRSFRKKRKIFLNKFFLKMSKVHNRLGKLAHQIHAIYFRKKNRKKTGDIEYATRRFLEEEFFNVGKNNLLKKKQFIYEKRGHEAMNTLLMRARYE